MRTLKGYTAIFTIGVGLSAASITGCNRTGQGVAIGAGAGGAVGAGIGAIAGGGKGAAIGAIVGAVVGGTTGGIIGHKMDQRAEQLRQDLKGAKVERVGEGILVTFDSGILFDTNQSDLKVPAQQNIGKLAEVLKRYDDTDILIAGHTDDVGTDDYNMELSRRRADSVATFAQAHGVKGQRIRTIGEGDKEPIADNTTDVGRAQNRRVEVAIFANDAMKDEIARNEEG